MNVIIAGSRSIKDYNLLKKHIKKSGFNITKIISGGANGVDKLGIKYAEENNIPYVVYSAKWMLYGKSAGIIRNIEMVEKGKPDAVIMLWDCVSKGTKHMIEYVSDRILNTYVYYMK